MEKDNEIVHGDSECLSVLKLKSEKYRVEIRKKENSALLNSKRFKLFSESQGSSDSNICAFSSEVKIIKQTLNGMKGNMFISKALFYIKKLKK